VIWRKAGSSVSQALTSSLGIIGQGISGQESAYDPSGLEEILKEKSAVAVPMAAGQDSRGEKHAFLELCLYKNDHFTKTGSGQTQGKLKTKAFFTGQDSTTGTSEGADGGNGESKSKSESKGVEQQQLLPLLNPDPSAYPKVCVVASLEQERYKTLLFRTYRPAVRDRSCILSFCI
jgi:hypothetical protein